MSQVKQHKIELAESEMLTRWYSVPNDLPTRAPPALHPGTGQPARIYYKDEGVSPAVSHNSNTAVP